MIFSKRIWLLEANERDKGTSKTSRFSRNFMKSKMPKNKSRHDSKSKIFLTLDFEMMNEVFWMNSKMTDRSQNYLQHSSVTNKNTLEKSRVFFIH